MPNDFPELIDPWRLGRASDVARALNVSRSTVYAWAESGILPTVRIGATIRFESRGRAPGCGEDAAWRADRSTGSPEPEGLMASAYKDGRYWYASFKTASGRWRAVATRAVTKGEAKRMAIELEQREGRIRHGLETALPSDGGGTVGELLSWWLRQTANAADAVRNVYSVRKHFMSRLLRA